MKAWERLINYVTVRTPSDEESETVPSSVCQFDLARKLEKEMKELGLTEVVLGISTSDRAKRTYTAHFGWNNDSGSR